MANILRQIHLTVKYSALLLVLTDVFKLIYSQAAVWHYKNLDIQLFDSYIEEKANPVIGRLEQSMYQGKFEWSGSPRPTGNGESHTICKAYS